MEKQIKELFENEPALQFKKNLESSRSNHYSKKETLASNRHYEDKIKSNMEEFLSDSS